MDIHEKAEKLHQLGHEVAAAALRRSAQLEPKLAKTFRAFKQMGQRVHGVQPGFIYGIHPMPALRVGKSVGPVTREEWLHHTGRMSFFRAGRSFGYDIHPLATSGHGLHPDHDPTPESFAHLRNHLDKPHVWPIIADHLEESGKRRALALAELLRQNVLLGPAERHGSLMSPATWPVQVRWGVKNGRFGVQVGAHFIQPNEPETTTEHGVVRYTRNLDRMIEGLK